jgi:hypothetical protein
MLTFKSCDCGYEAEIDCVKGKPQKIQIKIFNNKILRYETEIEIFFKKKARKKITSQSGLTRQSHGYKHSKITL